MHTAYSATEDDLYAVRRYAGFASAAGLLVLEVCDICGEAVEATVPGQLYAPLWLCMPCLVHELFDLRATFDWRMHELHPNVAST
jgi:hypothetical protein